MLIVSNHVTTAKVTPPQKAVVRVNIAWIKTRKELNKILDDSKNTILLDYPTGRFKPPIPTLGLEEVIDIANDRGIVKYFAISNVEDTEVVKTVRGQLSEEITLIPKIETENGVKNVLDICHAAKTITVMLDKDDLYVNVDKDEMIFNGLVQNLTQVCKDNNIHLLTLRGVIFSDE